MNYGRGGNQSVNRRHRGADAQSAPKFCDPLIDRDNTPAEAGTYPVKPSLQSNGLFWVGATFLFNSAADFADHQDAGVQFVWID